MLDVCRSLSFNYILIVSGMSDVDDDDLDDDSLMMDDRTDPNRVGARRDSLPSQVLGK
jgi:hypothetical protein